MKLGLEPEILSLGEYIYYIYVQYVPKVLERSVCDAINYFFTF